MSEITDTGATQSAGGGPKAGGAGWLMAGTAMLLVAAGGLLWAREGEKLFTDGLIAAIARCF